MRATSAASAINNSTLTLNLDDYPGGVAIWGALPAILDTTTQKFDRGVHVHARLTHVSKKCIDATYESVNVVWRNQQFLIDEATAVHFSLASIFHHKIISLTCEQCSQSILSSQLFSLIPHHEHICNHCGHINFTNKACVTNPVIELKKNLSDNTIKRKAMLPDRSLNIEMNQYPGGLQIWGSNPSIVWTASRAEESAIHVHAYANHERRVIDNTYSVVCLDGEYLDIEMIRMWQIQKMIPEVMSNVSVVFCPCCNTAQFDKGIYAVIPQTSRKCQQCAISFSHESRVSNPIINILNKFNHGDTHE
ncbi:MAG: hypothetical protein P4M12_10070 [Gammaproteobacteria bacterium]|nr:hypothetical protein [Gammaproteobacteria bacterium]